VLKQGRKVGASGKEVGGGEKNKASSAGIRQVVLVRVARREGGYKGVIRDKEEAKRTRGGLVIMQEGGGSKNQHMEPRK